MSLKKLYAFLAVLLLLIVGFSKANAGTGAIPKGPDVLILKPNLLFKGGDIKIMTGDDDIPTAVAKDAEKGTAYIRKSTGVWYNKTDDGSSMAWQLFIQGGIGLIGTDECVPRWDGTGTGVLQDGALCITDAGIATGLTGLTMTGDLTLVSATPSKPLQIDALGVVYSSNISATLDIDGILPVEHGGTGLDASAAPIGTFLIGNGTGFDLNVVSGTLNQVITSASAGGLTLALPQDIALTSTPEFVSATFSGLAPNEIMITDGASGVSTTSTIDLATQVSGILPPANGGSIYDNFIGTGGYADIDNAVTSGTSGDSIGYLSEIAPAVTASQTITKTLGFTGGGNGSTVNGNIRFQAGSDGSSLNNLKVDGNITIDAGVKNLSIMSVWLTAGKSVIDNSGNNSNLIIVVIEE